MSYDLLLQQGLKLHNAGRLDEAAGLYRQVLETAPDHPVVLNLLGLIAQQKGFHTEAIDFFSKAVAQNPQSAEYYFNLAWSEERAGLPAEAEKAYLQALKLQPGIKEAHNALGNIYLAEGNPVEACRQYETAAALDPAYAEPRANMARAKEDAAALAALEKQYPTDAVVPYYLALVLRRQGKTTEALAAAKRAEKLLPDEETLLLCGELCLAIDTSAATDYFRRALALNPKSVTALINLANVETDAGKAEAMYKKALDLEPDNIEAHINHAELLYREGRAAEALEEYRQAVILDPKRAETSNNLGIIEKDCGEYEEALGLFFNALVKQPNRREYAVNAAETLTLLFAKDRDKARKIAANWQRQMPDNVFACRLNEILNGADSGRGEAYARELFNQFAENYEKVMAGLDYALPQKIAALLGKPAGTIIELGCGTGLTGAVLKNENNRLIGVDISPAMLDKAREKGIYEQLIEADIGEYCRRLPAADLVVAADVFGYIGDLESIVAGVFPRKFCFSVALCTSDKNFELTTSGRYRHNPRYVKKLLQKAGYPVILEHECELRRENGQPVQGMIFTAENKAT